MRKPSQAVVETVKLYRTSSGYQTEPLCGTGIGRFLIDKTDNANARAIGRRPKWTVTDLYGAVALDRAELDTLDEVREWIMRRLAGESPVKTSKTQRGPDKETTMTRDEMDNSLKALARRVEDLEDKTVTARKTLDAIVRDLEEVGDHIEDLHIALLKTLKS